MRKPVIWLAAAALALTVGLCPRPGVPELEDVLAMDEAAAVTRVRGRSRAQLAEAWGAPDRESADADVWTTDGVTLLTVYYREGEAVLCSRRPALFPDEAESLTVRTESETRKLTGEEIAAVRDWAAGLDTVLRVFDPGQQPTQVQAGGESWIFAADGEDCFAYLSLDKDYLLCGGQWFEVQNPSPPPV